MMKPAPRKTYPVLGQAIDITNIEQAAQDIARFAKDDKGRFICCRDVASLMALIKPGYFCAVHRRAAMVLPDGMPLVWLARAKGQRAVRVCGPDLMAYLLGDAQYAHLKHFFFGGAPGVAAQLSHRLKALYPHLEIVGHYTPDILPERPSFDPEWVKIIGKSEADIVWVGLSSPKQDYWMHAHYKSLGASLIGVGAAFDFHAGTKRRAPKWMQGLGLEWLFRLYTEPRRLWRRYIVLAPKFVVLALGDLRRFFRGQGKHKYKPE